jgi:hypothetical protein
MVGGHTVFHLTLLIVSMIGLGFPKETEENADFHYTINLLRIAHGIDVFFAILKFLGSSPEAFAKHCFTYRIMDTVKMFLYLSFIMYAIFHETQILDAVNSDDYWIRHAEVWIRMELIVFFF